MLCKEQNMEIDEQQDMLRKEENMMKIILVIRRFLYSIGQYELEDGEIIK